MVPMPVCERFSDQSIRVNAAIRRCVQSSTCGLGSVFPRCGVFVGFPQVVDGCYMLLLVNAAIRRCDRISTIGLGSVFPRRDVLLGFLGLLMVVICCCL